MGVRVKEELEERVARELIEEDRLLQETVDREEAV